MYNEIKSAENIFSNTTNVYFFFYFEGKKRVFNTHTPRFYMLV